MVTTGQAPWPAVAVGSALAVAVLGFLWIALARRIAPRDGDLASGVASAAVAGLFLGFGVAIAASMTSGAPALGFTIAAHVAFLLALLALSALVDRPWLAPLSIISTTAAVAGWRIAHLEGPPYPWWHELAFAGR